MNKQILYISLSTIIFIVTAIINIFGSQASINGTNQIKLSAKYSTPITPPGWAFSIWGLIYIWQSLWIVLLLFQSFKYSQQLTDNDHVIFGCNFYFGWIVSCILNGAWIILFAYERQAICAVILVFTAFSLYLTAYSSIKYVGLAKQVRSGQNEGIKFPQFILEGRTLELYDAVNNGLQFYGTWVTAASFGLGVAIFLIYVAEALPSVTATTCLSIVGFGIVVYAFLDLIYCRTWLVNCYAVYPMLFWIFGSMSSLPSDPDTPNGLITALLALSVVIFVFKIISSVVFYARGGQAPKNQTDTAYQTMNAI